MFTEKKNETRSLESIIQTPGDHPVPRPNSALFGVKGEKGLKRKGLAAKSSREWG
jgi:hypothetical protein